jgi:hypothetical protein
MDAPVPTQQLIILDQPPLDRTRWAGQVIESAGYVEASQAKIDAAVKADADAARALRETFLDPQAPQKVAPHYWKAFQSLYGDQPRVGIYGTAWLVFAPKVDACIVDWSGLGRISPETARKLSLEEAMQARDTEITLGKAFIRERAAVVPEGRLLELPDGIDDAARVAQSLAFLRSGGLAA